MRVTQSMLALNTLRHISQGYERLGKLQDQLASGKKITRPSQDPVVAMNGMRYRSQVVEVKQFNRNIGEVYNWLDNADSTLDKTTAALHRIRELAVQAANDTYESTQRSNIAKEIEQLFYHVVEMANTKSNGKYIFNGTDTIHAPVDPEKIDLGIGAIDEYGNNKELLEISYAGEIYKFVYEDDSDGDAVFDAVFVNSKGEKMTIRGYNTDSPTIEHEYITQGYYGTEILKEKQIVVSDRTAVSTNMEDVKIELLKGVTIATNIRPQNVFSNALFGDIIALKNMLEDPETSHEDITKFMDIFDKHIDRFVSERAELGARVNRAEMIEQRQLELDVIAQRIMSDNEDADMEEVIIQLTIQESVHRAALAAGARIIQPTLMDFLR